MQCTIEKIPSLSKTTGHYKEEPRSHRGSIRRQCSHHAFYDVAKEPVWEERKIGRLALVAEETLSQRGAAWPSHIRCRRGGTGSSEEEDGEANAGGRGAPLPLRPVHGRRGYDRLFTSFSVQSSKSMW